MRPTILAAALAAALTTTGAIATTGTAKGTFVAHDLPLEVAFAVADRDGESGPVRVLLAEEALPLEGVDLSLDRLDALRERAGDRYVILEWNEDFDCVNTQYAIADAEGQGMSGGGGCHDAAFEISADGVTGSAGDDEEWKLDFDAGWLPPREKLRDLPADGGEPGAALRAELDLVDSGGRDALLARLTPEQRATMEEMPEEEVRELLDFMLELAPRLEEMRGGALYDGYAILEFTGNQAGDSGPGRALLEETDAGWTVVRVSCCG